MVPLITLSPNCANTFAHTIQGGFIQIDLSRMDVTNNLYLQVIRAYASNRAWIIGFLMDIFGAVLMLLALSQAPVYIIKLIYLISDCSATYLLS